MAWFRNDDSARAKSVPLSDDKRANSLTTATPMDDMFPSLPTSSEPPDPSSTHTATQRSTSVPVIAPSMSYRNSLPKIRIAETFPLFEAGNATTSSLDTSPGPCDFPFLSDPNTVRYLAQVGSKLVTVLRGVSGSGKSTLCGRIVKELGEAGVKVDVVSADHFFTQRDGSYCFNRGLLDQAHSACQHNFEKLCRIPESQVIIVDNTNIVYQDFVIYFQLAHRYRFVSLLVEPKTEWRYNVQQLVKRNLHGVTQKIIADKVQYLTSRFIAPLYYGWMISGVDGDALYRSAVKLARSMLLADEFSQAVEGRESLLINRFLKSVDKGEEDLISGRLGKDLLHCTAFYTDFGKARGVKEYEQSDVVERSLGKLFSLNAVGLLVTPNTISLRLQLTADQLKLWNQDGEGRASIPRGSRAHLTLLTGTGIQAYVAGMEMMKFVKCSMDWQPTSSISISLGNVLHYQKDYWYLALEAPLSVDCLFASFYSGSRTLASGSASPARSKQ